MWFFYNKQNQLALIIPSFGNEEEYIVGRKGLVIHCTSCIHTIEYNFVSIVHCLPFDLLEGECHLLIEKDKSISRKHTVFKLKDNHGEQLEMGDFSKYGAELDGEKLKNGVKYTLDGSNNEHEYTIKFGVCDSVFRYFMRLYICVCMYNNY